MEYIKRQIPKFSSEEYRVDDFLTFHDDGHDGNDSSKSWGHWGRLEVVAGGSGSANQIQVPPYPVLMEGTASFPKGGYKIQPTKAERGKHELILEHEIEGAGLIDNFIKEEKAVYACAIASPRSAYRDIQLSLEPLQQITWQPDNFAEPPYFIPMVVCKEEIKYQLNSKRDGIDEILDSVEIVFPKGAFLAAHPAMRLRMSGIRGLIHLRRAKEPFAGQFCVNIDEDTTFKFSVKCKPDFYDFLMNNKGEIGFRYGDTMRNIITACFACLQREYGERKEDNEGAGWRAHESLEALARDLEEKGYCDWSSKEFQPEQAATLLHPHGNSIRGAETVNDWKQLNSQEYKEFRNQYLPAVHNRGNARQREFLEQAKDRDEFLKAMEEITTTEKRPIPKLSRPMTEAEFKNPPFSTEELIYQQWKTLTPSITSSPAFWAHVTIEHIREKILDASYLAGNGSNNQTGQERIERALGMKEGDDKNKRIDDCVRSIFRQLGGLPGIRGNRSVFVDCPLARAWWRQHLASRAAERTGLTAEVVGLSIRQTKTHWEQVVSAMVSRNPVLGLDKVQDALLVGLVSIFAPSHEGYREDDVRTAGRVQSICQRLCFEGGSRELGMYEPKELQVIVDNIV